MIRFQGSLCCHVPNLMIYPVSNKSMIPFNTKCFFSLLSNRVKHTLNYATRLLPFVQAGLFIDKGVKTSNASAADPREYLCLDNNARSV